MHCNMRPPDITAVVLGFNYEAHDATAYNSNNFVTTTDEQCTHTYHISAKLHNQRRSYCDLNMSNLGTVSCLGFDPKLIFTIRRPPGTHIAPPYQTSTKRAMNGWVIDDLDKFFRLVFRGRGTILSFLVLRVVWEELLTSDLEWHRLIISAPKRCFTFHYFASFRKQSALKSTGDENIGQISHSLTQL